MKAIWNPNMNNGEMEVFEENMIDYTVWNSEDIADYWMATMRIDETKAPQMSELEEWLNGEIQCGLTHEDMVATAEWYRNR